MRSWPVTGTIKRWRFYNTNQLKAMLKHKKTWIGTTHSLKHWDPNYHFRYPNKFGKCLNLQTMSMRPARIHPDMCKTDGDMRGTYKQRTDCSIIIFLQFVLSMNVFSQYIIGNINMISIFCLEKSYYNSLLCYFTTNWLTFTHSEISIIVSDWPWVSMVVIIS